MKKTKEEIMKEFRDASRPRLSEHLNESHFHVLVRDLLAMHDLSNDLSVSVPASELSSLKTRLLAAYGLGSPLSLFASVVTGDARMPTQKYPNGRQIAYYFFKERVQLVPCGENSAMLTAIYSLRLGEHYDNNLLDAEDRLDQLKDKVTSIDTTGEFSTHYRTDTILSFDELEALTSWRMAYTLRLYHKPPPGQIWQRDETTYRIREWSRCLSMSNMGNALPNHRVRIMHRPELLRTDTETIDTIGILEVDPMFGIVRNFSSLEEAIDAPIDIEKMKQKIIRTEEEPLEWILPKDPRYTPVRINDELNLQRLRIDVEGARSGTKLSDYMVDAIICLPTRIRLIGPLGDRIVIDRGAYMPYLHGLDSISSYPNSDTHYLAHQIWVKEATSGIGVAQVVDKYSSVAHSVTDDSNGATPQIAARPLEFVQSEPDTLTSSNRGKRKI
jgi:hypothetical protein